MKETHIFSFKLIFYIELLSLFIIINSFSFYILDNPKEKEDSKSNSLIFTINGGVDQSFNEDKYFKIQVDVYKDYDKLNENNLLVKCTIPKSPSAEFGTSIKATCEIDLLSLPNANKIKFIDFIINDNNLKINDLKKYVLDNSLSFSKKKVELKPDMVFKAEKVKSLKCEGNKFIFGIEGEINKFHVKQFTFDINLNENYPIKANCECPDKYLYFSSVIMINCTIIALNDDTFMENLKKGIEIKANYYTIKDNDGEKLLQIKIKEDKEKIQFKEFDCNNNEQKERESNDRDNYRKSNRGDKNDKKDDYSEYYNSFKNIFSNKNKDKSKDEEDDSQKRWEREREEERRRKKEREEREKEEEKKKKDQEDLEQILRKRQREKEEDERKNRYNDYDNNYNQNRRKDYDNNDNNNNNQGRNDDDEIDYNNKVKLIHLQVRYSYGFIYYMFYALSPVPLGHKIKARFSISKYNYNTGYNEQDYKYIILKAEEEINKNDKNIIIEYIAKYECQQCKKMVLDRNNIQGAKIYNIPEDQYQLDAIEINTNNYLTRNKMENPPLYITENIYNQNCMVQLIGNFFNNNKFFASKFPLTLISVGYYGNNRNITIYCSLNERGNFACPINDILNNFEYKLEPLIVNQKENIIIDNSEISRGSMSNHITCQSGNNLQLNTDNNMKNNNYKLNENVEGNKFFTWKKIIFGIIIMIILYYLISQYCCTKEEEYPEEYNSRWRVSSSTYGGYGGGESYGLRNKW